MYRNFRGDSPAEQRSGFALEAKEMAIVLDQALCSAAESRAPRNFVCVDEFGKGTEDRAASALAAGIILYLDRVRPAAAPLEQHGRALRRWRPCMVHTCAQAVSGD
jgi:DNA mismatch repair ATPase MutS